MIGGLTSIVVAGIQTTMTKATALIVVIGLTIGTENMNDLELARLNTAGDNAKIYPKRTLL